MKICMINPSDFPRSEIFNLGYHLGERGHEITILYPTDGKIINAKGHVQAIPFPASFLAKIHYTVPNFGYEYKVIKNLIEKENYDIIQVCDYDYLTAIPPLIAKKLLNLSVILSTDAFPGISWYFGNKFVDTVGKMYTKTLGKHILKSADELVVLGNNLTHDALRLGVSPEKLHVIPIGVDITKFTPDSQQNGLKPVINIEYGEKVILFVGRLSLVKRVDILIEATKQLVNLGYKIRTLIIGEGEFKDYYQKKARGFKEIQFLGKISNDELPRYYRIADIFVLPSISEGLPNVLLEAAACAIPIIATDTGCISDIVIHNRNGFLVKSGEVSEFLYYIKHLLDDPELSKTFGYQGHEHVTKNYDWNRIVSMYEALYQKYG